MRTEKEFMAEILRRKEALEKEKKSRRKKLFSALACAPLFCIAAFLTISLAIAMMPAGSADKTAGHDPGASNGNCTEYYNIGADDARTAPLLDFFREMEEKEPENSVPQYSFSDEAVNAVTYRVRIDDRVFFVRNDRVLINGCIYLISESEFAEFRKLLEE